MRVLRADLRLWPAALVAAFASRRTPLVPRPDALAQSPESGAPPFRGFACVGYRETGGVQAEDAG